MSQHYPEIYGGVHELKAVAFHSWSDTSTVADSIEIEYLDYRDPFFGDFDFVIRRITNSKLSGLERDTFYHTGIVRPYERSDQDQQFYPFNGHPGSIFESITIEIGLHKVFATVMDESGNFSPRMGPHYYHMGSFHGTDSISFEMTGLGGLSYYIDYYIVGRRL